MPRDIIRLAYRANMSADDSDVGELMLYGEIVQDYSKWYKEQFPNDKSATDFDKAVKELKSNGAKRLNLRINSPGGIVNEAVAMRGILTGAGFESINIRIEGMCASAATILATIPGANVVITPGSRYMIHNPWTYAWGNANDMGKVIEQLRQLEATSRAFYVQKSGQAEDQIKRWMDDETWFIAEDAVKYGFADELAKETADNALPAAACVTSAEMAAMREMYKAVPDDIQEFADEAEANSNVALFGDNAVEFVMPPRAAEASARISAIRDAINHHVSNGTPVAGAPTEINHHEEEDSHMDIKDINLDQLRAENPGLLASIQQEALTAEHQRCEDIDALTLPGYEAMAAEAKANGTSVTDYQRQIVQAMKQKGTDFMQNRQKETAPANSVPGGAPSDSKNDEQEMAQFVKDIAAYANAYNGTDNGGMY